ncbi:hypothetical protein IPM62_02315 [Candidatus Woesebacteria bacterium]|nr:MAG: hypothetical protein IPM62_02315 [Candidatus Woesebacteria bacterium]
MTIDDFLEEWSSVPGVTPPNDKVKTEFKKKHQGNNGKDKRGNKGKVEQAVPRNPSLPIPGNPDTFKALLRDEWDELAESGQVKPRGPKDDHWLSRKRST